MELREQKQEVGLYLTKRDFVEALTKNEDMLKMPFKVTFEGLQLQETSIYDQDKNKPSSEKQTVKRYNFKFSADTLLKFGINSIEEKLFSIDIPYLIGDELQELSKSNAKINNEIKKLNKSTSLNEKKQWVDENNQVIKGQSINMSFDVGSFDKEGGEKIKYLIIKIIQD